MSIVIFASFPVCNTEIFIRGEKIRRTSFPSCPYKSFSTALNLGVNTSPCLEKQSATPNEHACNYRPTHRAQAQCSYLLQQQCFRLYMEGQMGCCHQMSLRKQKNRGSCLVFLPRLGERTRVHSRVAGSEGLMLLERLQWHHCPLPTPKITYVDRGTLRMEPS